jgi:RNA polymerase sigma-70 factor (ECF subfamily)
MAVTFSNRLRPKSWSGPGSAGAEPIDDAALVRAALAGEATAFDELMRRHQRLIFMVSWRFCRDHEAALDLTQTVFLKAWRGLDGFRGEASLKTWLLRIAYREGLNARRRRSPLDRAERLEVEETAEGAAAARHHAASFQSAAQEVEVLERERAGRLRRALDGIHHRYRRAIELRYAQELSIREISAVLETSEAMAKNLLFRGVKSLRRALDAETLPGRPAGV